MLRKPYFNTIIAIVSVTLLLTSTSRCLQAAEQRRITFCLGSNIMDVNGSSQIMEVSVYSKNGRIYVPVRYLAMGLSIPDEGINWDAKNKAVSLSAGSRLVEMTVGSDTVYVQRIKQIIDAPPEIIEGRVMVPVRFISTTFFHNVGWNPTTKEVLITTP